jgi:Tfp pilus assembly protein PilV
MAMMLSLRPRTHSRPVQGQPRARSGISVIEVMVAMMLFGTVTIAMAGMSLAVARRADANDLFTKRTATLQQQMNRLQALPYDSIATKGGTVTISTGPFPHKRKITLSATGSRTRVTIQIIPTKAPTSAETIAFDRARPTNSPLCKGC